MIRFFISMICSIAILMQPLFFSVMGLLGFEYEGSDSSIVYVVYLIIVAVLSLTAYVYAAVHKGVLRGELLLLYVFLIVFFIHGLWVIFDQINTPFLPMFFIFFLLLGLPGFLSAVTVIKLNLVPELLRISEVFFILIAIGITLFSVLPSLAGVRTASIGGATYQALSYYASFSFGMLLAYSLHLPKNMRYKFTSKIWYRFTSYTLMFSCILGCLLGGGRGAFILLLVYLGLSTARIFFDKKNILTKRGLLYVFIMVGTIILIVTIFTTMFWENEFIQFGFNRAIGFISPSGGIDLAEGSSGRDTVYSIALNYIQQRPFLGYGPFGYFEQTIQSHNIFLDILLQFGVFGLMLFLALMLGILIRFFKHRSNLISFWLLSLLIYPLVMHMFSGTYMHNSIFIFGICYIFLMKKERYSIVF